MFFCSQISKQLRVVLLLFVFHMLVVHLDVGFLAELNVTDVSFFYLSLVVNASIGDLTAQ